MRIGAVFPQTEIGSDPAKVKDYAQAVEEIGFDHILTFDHILGGNAATHNLKGPYKHTDSFHELFVLYGYLAAVTQKIELASGIIILGQRQTALVAKQAAAIDILSNGRLRLGVGIGWNDVEYEALGMNFTDRGKRSEEQIDVMRKLMGSTSGLNAEPGTIRGDFSLSHQMNLVHGSDSEASAAREIAFYFSEDEICD